MKSRARLRLLVFLIACLIPGGALQAQDRDAPPPQQVAQNLKQLTLEELADLTVTSAARRGERLSDVAAAVRSFAARTSAAPGRSHCPRRCGSPTASHVAQVYGPGWAISTRGFNISTANKLLVLIDGRTVYSPLFSGVFWDVQDVVLDDIDRIEVIRGPGGTLWGANAVNGVVNIITKSAADTQGGFVEAAVGNETRAIATGRYGGTTSGGTAYRAYAKFRADDEHVFATGAPGHDDVQFGRSGFRIDSDAAKPDVLDASGRRLLRHRGPVRPGQHAGVRRQRAGSCGRNAGRRNSQLQTQVYYDRTNRRVQRQYRATGDTVDIDAQQQMQLGSRHTSCSAAAFESRAATISATARGSIFDPQVRTSTLVSFFGQDDIALKPDRLSLIVGSKVERNDFTGFEIQPNVRLRLTPDLAADVLGRRVAGGPHADPLRRRPAGPRAGTARLLLTGSDTFESENVLAYEAGYRVRPTEQVSFDVVHLRQQLRRPQKPGTADGGRRSGRARQHAERQDVRRRNRGDRAPDGPMAGARVVQLPVGTVFTRSRQPRHQQRCQRGQRSIASVLGADIGRPAAQDRARRAVPLCVRAAAAVPFEPYGGADGAPRLAAVEPAGICPSSARTCSTIATRSLPRAPLASCSSVACTCGRHGDSEAGPGSPLR